MAGRAVLVAAMICTIQGKRIEVGRPRLKRLMNALDKVVANDCTNKADMDALDAILETGLGGKIHPTEDHVYHFVDGQGRSGGCCSPSPLVPSCRIFCTHGSLCSSLGGTCTLIEIARSIDPLTSCFSKDFPTLSPYTGWAFCAIEGNECHCNGALLYGRRFAYGEPGSGAKAGVEAMLKSPHKIIQSTGKVSCDHESLGGDPLPLMYKKCLCGTRKIGY